jgi:hypothetical protein
MNASSLGSTAAFLGVLTVLIILGVIAGIGWFIYRYAKVQRREISGVERLRLDAVLMQSKKAAQPPQPAASAPSVEPEAVEHTRVPEAAAGLTEPPVRRSTRRPPQNPDALPARSLR